MATDAYSPFASLRREVSERLHSFFVGASDGRSTSSDAGAALASSQGPHRERNEDRAAIVRFRFGSVRTDLRLALLCDGMGGMQKGGEAAALAMGSFIAAFATIAPECTLDDRLERSCMFANKAVHNAYGGEAGTTLTAVAFANYARFAVHVGDSRLYGIDSSRYARLMTKDHTVSGAVNEHLGNLDEDELDNRLLQFVGIGPLMQPDVINLGNYDSHALWLLTSDGAHSIGKKTLAGICEGSKNAADLVRKVVYVAEAMNTRDNATAICIKSGFVASSKDEHEGLTLQITAPDSNLEIWLPPTVIQMSDDKVGTRTNLRLSTYDEDFSDSLPLPVPTVRKPIKKRTTRTVRLKSATAVKRLRQPKSTEKSSGFDFKPEDDSDA